jgi:hypothetical protein
MRLNVILYCNSKVPEVIGEASEHWKNEMPALAASEVIRDFYLLKKQGTKRVFHCLVEKNKQLPRIVNWIDNYNEGMADSDKIWYWSGQTAKDAYIKLWKDNNSFAHLIAEKVLRYPAFIGEEGSRVFVSVYEAINTHGIAIDPDTLKQYGISHTFFGE